MFPSEVPPSRRGSIVAARAVSGLASGILGDEQESFSDVL